MAERSGLDLVGHGSEAADALAGIRACEPDVVLLDNMMPGFEGQTAIERVRHRAPEAKVIMYSSLPLAAMVRHEGADAYVEKTRPVQDLWNAISATTGRRV